MNLDYLNEGLLEQIEQAFKEIRENAYAEGYKQGRYDAEMDAIHTVPIPNKPTSTAASIAEKFFKELQAKRDEIVEKAKRDVVEILTKGYVIISKTEQYADGSGSSSVGVSSFLNMQFYVNKEKRTVVAVAKNYNGNTLRGIAKCAPDDCFNVHIGKAIALRRALGLEVPTEYLNAPQPTEVRVGDVITVYNLNDYKVLDITEGFYVVKCLTDGSKYTSPINCFSGIVDDSRDGEASG